SRSPVISANRGRSCSTTLTKSSHLPIIWCRSLVRIIFIASLRPYAPTSRQTESINRYANNPKRIATIGPRLTCGECCSMRGFVERGLTQRFGQEAVSEVVHGGLRVGYHQLHLGLQWPVQFPAQIIQVSPFRQLEERRQISRGCIRARVTLGRRRVRHGTVLQPEE